MNADGLGMLALVRRLIAGLASDLRTSGPGQSLDRRLDCFPYGKVLLDLI